MLYLKMIIVRAWLRCILLQIAIANIRRSPSIPQYTLANVDKHNSHQYQDC